MKRFLLAAVATGGLCLAAAGQDATTRPAPAKAAVDPPAEVTFNEHIAPIVFNNCTSCHRPGEAGPFPLLNYTDARKRGKMIQQVTERRSMPPWHPAPGYGEFLHERRLSDQQLALIKRWVETGMAEGDAARLPKLPTFPEGWQLGTPDLIVTMDRAFPVPATGRDIYRNFVLPLNLKEDKWVTAVELRPGARSVVHHVLFFLDSTGQARAKDGKDGKPGFSGMSFAGGLGGKGGKGLGALGGLGSSIDAFSGAGSLGGWAAGGTPHHLPGGLGMPLPKGSDLVLQTHFHPSGKAENEKTTVGLYFAKEKPARTLASFQVPPLFGALAGINVPAGAKDYRIKATFKAPVDMELISAGGHAHYICESMKAKATLPDGTVTPLLHIPRWDFNWQGSYVYRDPVKLPKNSVIDVEVVYNNSADNPANPFSPPKRIAWGTASTDEMGSIIFGAVAQRESEARALQQGIRRQLLDLRGLLGKGKGKE